MIKNSMLRSLFILILLFPMPFIGCSSGGGDAPAPVPSPSIRVLPSSYDFGIVTSGNSPAPLEVEIQNNGSLTLNVSSITLSDTDNLNLDPNGGSNPCNTESPSIAPGGNCTVVVEFDPQPGAPNPFLANLTITSNASNNSRLNVPLMADLEDVSAIDVRINQVEACPGPGVVTAYVSVTDQGGYPVIGLTATDFTITENVGGVGDYDDPPTNAFYVSDNGATISVALVMDYSGSITEIPDAVDDMEGSVVNFVDNLGDDDEAEIIKFATTIEVAQDYTSDKTLLTNAVYNPLNLGNDTALYDAIVQALDNAALRLKTRRAVILITDGKDASPDGGQLSTHNLIDVINNANSNGIPVFTIGLGNQVDSTVLQQIADDTGGQFFEAITSDNLRTIYQQLADILFEDTYVLTYPSLLTPPFSLTIEATYSPTIKGNDTKGITACP